MRTTMLANIVTILAGLILASCSTALHGSFLTQTYTDQSEGAGVMLGDVEDQSCQTRPFYIFAIGEPATTEESIRDAKSRIERMRFMADISIDDETDWKFLYSVQCITVTATAYQ